MIKITSVSISEDIFKEYGGLPWRVIYHFIDKNGTTRVTILEFAEEWLAQIGFDIVDQIRIILDVNGEDEAEYKIKMDALDDN